jgi:glycolate oxidase iron-sulfur subunit
VSEVAERLRRELATALSECVHCGFCLPACPTYVETGKEMDSPRGRIGLAAALARGRIGVSEPVQRHLDLCLDCRACETACPSGVPYGEIIERTRAVIEPHRGRPLGRRLLRWLALRQLLPHRRRLALAMLPLRVHRASGLRRLLRRSRLGRLLPHGLRRLERLAPEVRGRSFLARAPETYPARGERRARVALFTGCVMDHTSAEVHRATARVLAHHGCEVVVPREQTCCGALHVHNGDREFARGLARRNIEAFARAGVDAVVVDAAGCGAQLREYGGLLAGEDGWADRAAELVRSAVDATRFLVRLGPLEPRQPVAARAVWDAPCHLLHAQGIDDEPRALLARIPGLELLPLAEAEMCCGSAGVYNLTQPEMSRRLLERKLRHIERSGADLVVTANPGCQFQLEAGVDESGLDARVVHLMELLEQAYGLTDQRM